jgi:hypothetical protein
MMKGMPNTRVVPDGVTIAGGMDIVGSPIFSKPGHARIAYNYEWSTGGGLERIAGIEPFDGRPSPSAAVYVYLQCSEAIAGISLGDTVDGATSGASGHVIYLSGAFIALTRVAGSFLAEDLEVSAVVKATVSNTSPAIDGFLDNTLAKLAADDYQADIGKVPGSGRVRGLAILNDEVYAWRDNTDATAMNIHKASSSGWTLVDLNSELPFDTGATAAPAEGATLTQGGTTATILRVVLESGTFAGGNAAGRLIIGSISGGVFAAGAATYPGGSIAATGADSAIVLSPGGRVRTDAYTFTAALADKRLYGCDGVNPEFEFDGTVYAPLNTGMGTIRASFVRCHKSYLYLAYRGSLQRSAIGDPYVWSAVFGAAELGTGDEITNLISVGGATDAAALMVLCRNALFVLYEDATTTRMDPLSRISGAQPDSAQDIGGVVALDSPGVMRYPYTRNFGNFAWDTVSMDIQPIAKNQQCVCSVYVSGKFKYRIFFTDGTAISGLPVGKGQFEWSVINYGRNIVIAEHAEIAGDARTFYADNNGWVYEADKGRSLAGDPLPYAVKLLPLTQRSPMTEKTYRTMQLEVECFSACTLYTSGEFGNGEDGPTQQTTDPRYGVGLNWDLSNYDQAYWDTATVGLTTLPLEGVGTRVSISVAGESDNELPHSLYAVTVLYTPRRMTR